MPPSLDDFYFYSLAMFFSPAVGPIVPHCSADHFAVAFVKSEYQRALCHCFATGDVRLHFSFHRVSTKDGKSNNSHLYRSKHRTSLISAYSLFLSCQRLFGSIIKIWRLLLLWHPQAKPPDAGARTRKPHWPCDTEGIDKIISLASIQSQLSQNSSVMFFFFLRTSCG